MRLWGKSEKKAEEARVENVAKISELDQLCGSDKDLYEALQHVMFLDPRKIGESMKDAAAKAEQFENVEDFGSARIWYDIAGGLAIYEGNAKKVVEFFTESERLSGMKYPILNRAEDAVAKAQEYYRKHLKDEAHSYSDSLE
jgi:hypothetical protein